MSIENFQHTRFGVSRVICGAPSQLALRRGPRGYSRIECLLVKWPMTAPRVMLSFTHIHRRRTQTWTGRKHRFSSLSCDRDSNPVFQRLWRTRL